MDEKSTNVENPSAAPAKKSRLPVVLAILLVLSLAGNIGLGLLYRQQNKRADDIQALYTGMYFNFDSLTVDSFKAKVASGEEFVVLITRPNCSNCVAMEQPFIELVTEKGIADKIYHLNVVLLRRDQEAWDAFKQTYGLDGTPTYARYANGQQVSRVGWTPENGVNIEMVTEWIAQQDDFFSAG